LSTLIRQVGATTDGKPVVAGVFSECETTGLPLDVLLELMRDRGYVPDWPALYQEARAAGMKHERVLSRLGEAIGDTYGVEMRDVVLSRLGRLYGTEASA
jgi:hypothetical protein